MPGLFCFPSFLAETPSFLFRQEKQEHPPSAAYKMHSCEETIGNADTNPVSRNRRNTMKLLKTIGLMAVLLMAFSPLEAGVMPEMQECMQAHVCPEEYRAVLNKYCDPGIIRKAMALIVIRSPHVIHTEQDGNAVCYTVEGTTVETSSEIPSDTTQVYRVCWENTRIQSLAFLGAKSKKAPPIIPEMQECMQSHGSREQYGKVLQKYCGNNMIRRAMSLLVIKNPYVIKTEKIGTAIYYTVQGTTVETSCEIPTETTQVYRVCWDSGKIVSLKFLGGQEGEKS
jgi:hypothetical protein